MNIRPVAELGNSQYFIWELTDITLPKGLDEIIEKSEWKEYGRNILLKHPSKRFIADKFDATVFDPILKYLNYIIRNREDYNILPIWPLDPKNSFLDSHWGTKIIKDQSDFYMSAHIDNNLMFATCIINLQDNGENTTEYFKDSGGKELMYKSSGTKGTGVLHVNSPFLYHSAYNKSEKDRIISISNLNISAVINNGKPI